MVIISNPGNIAPDISTEYPEWPREVRGAHWFDDFNRNSVKARDVTWAYFTQTQDADVSIDTDGFRALRFLYNSTSGRTFGAYVRCPTAVWGFDYAQSPYDPPSGVELEYSGLEITGDDCGFTVGIVAPDFGYRNDANDLIGITIGSNIAGQNIVNLINKNGTRQQTDTFFNPPSGTKYNARIRYEPERIVDWFVTRSDTGQTVAKSQVPIVTKTQSLVGYFGASFNVQGTSARCPRWGVRYF